MDTAPSGSHPLTVHLGGDGCANRDVAVWNFRRPVSARAFSSIARAELSPAARSAATSPPGSYRHTDRAICLTSDDGSGISHRVSFATEIAARTSASVIPW